MAALAASTGCQRTPPEPSPAATTQARVTPEPAVAPAAAPPPIAREGRCVSDLAFSPPPAPPPVMPGQCPRDPGGEGNLPHVRVSFPEAKGEGGALAVDAELVTTAPQIERGLMYRTSMGENAGMLFRLAERKEHTFWMHNTCLSLDMLFVEDDGLVVGIVERAAPLTDDIRTVGCPSKWVLEVNAGWARRHGVAPGQRMIIPREAR